MKYLSRVSNEKIVEFLIENGLYLLDSIEEQIEGCDKDTEDAYYLRCYSPNKNDVVEELKKYIEKKLPQVGFSIGKYLYSPIDMYLLNDFFIQRLFIDDEFTQFDMTLQHNFHQMMMEEFSEDNEYLNDYNAYIDSLEDEQIQ